MKLSKCTYGTLVQRTAIGDERVGMIIGISVASGTHWPYTTYTSSAIPLVRWQDGAESTIHPADIEIYKD